MKKYIIILITLFYLTACLRSQDYKIREFSKAMDNRIGTEMTQNQLKHYNKLWGFSSEKISAYIIRYHIKMDSPDTSGGKDCEVYEDVYIVSNKILKWGYISSPDKCSIKRDWLN